MLVIQIGASSIVAFSQKLSKTWKSVFNPVSPFTDYSVILQLSCTSQPCCLSCCSRMRPYDHTPKVCETISQIPLLVISQNLQLRCCWTQKGVIEILMPICQRSKSQPTTHGQMSYFGGIFISPEWMNKWTRFNEIYQTDSLQRLWRWWHCQGRGFKGQGHGQQFPKMHFSGGGIPIDGSPSKTIQFY